MWKKTLLLSWETVPEVFNWHCLQLGYHNMFYYLNLATIDLSFDFGRSGKSNKDSYQEIVYLPKPPARCDSRSMFKRKIWIQNFQRKVWIQNFQHKIWIQNFQRKVWIQNFQRKVWIQNFQRKVWIQNFPSLWLVA